MSQETMQWLNEMTLIGNTDKRGNAWHYRQSDQTAESNHYAGPIPTADVTRRLFHWTPAEGDVTSMYLGADDFEAVTDPSRKTIIRPRGTFGAADDGEILGIFKTGYNVHDYQTWLVDTVADILDSGLQIGSAGLLRGGAVAWVQCELDETVTTPEGVQFRPFLTAATSVDGSLSTTYQTGAQVVVCDNTLACAMGERTNRVKIRHSKNSTGKLADVRDALGIVHNVADEFAANVAALTQQEVTPQEWSKFLTVIAPVKGGEDDTKPSISRTLATARRAELDQLWNYDARVNLWKGTAFGVVQAVNTHAHHVQGVRGMARAERNMTRMVEGAWATLDSNTLQALATAKQLVGAAS